MLETKVESIQDTLTKLEAAVEELKPVVWKAAGGATVILAIVQVLTKGLH